MKKIVAALAALILVISIIPFAAFAANGPQAIMSAVSAKAGDTVTLKVKLAGFPAFQSGSFELTSLPEGISLKEGKWLIADGDMDIASFSKKDMRGVFSLEQNSDLNKDVLEIKLEVGKAAKSGKNEIKFAMKFMYSDGAFLDGATMQNGSVTVSGGTTAPDEKTDDEPATDVDPDENPDEPTDENPDDTTPDDGETPTDENPDDTTDDETRGEPDDGENASDGDKDILPIILIAVAAAIALGAVAYFVVMLTKKKK